MYMLCIYICGPGDRKVGLLTNHFQLAHSVAIHDCLVVAIHGADGTFRMQTLVACNVAPQN